jgi:hypothetical protein
MKADFKGGFLFTFLPNKKDNTDTPLFRIPSKLFSIGKLQDLKKWAILPDRNNNYWSYYRS